MTTERVITCSEYLVERSKRKSHSVTYRVQVGEMRVKARDQRASAGKAAKGS